MQISGVSLSKSCLALLQEKKKSNNPCATTYVYSSLPCTNTSCQRHLTPITLRCVLTPSSAIISQRETSWYVTVQHYPVAWLCWRRCGGAGTVVRVLSALISLSWANLKLLKVVFIFLYCIWYSPVLIVVLDKQRSWVSRTTLPHSAEAEPTSDLLSTSCVFMSNTALTQSKHRKCQQLFTESFTAAQGNKVFCIREIKHQDVPCERWPKDDQRIPLLSGDVIKPPHLFPPQSRPGQIPHH